MKKNVKYIFMGLLVFAALPILYAYLVYPVEYINRVFRLGDADVYDYQKLFEHPLDASDSSFEFSLNLDEDRIRTQFEAVSGMDDFDSFLTKNRTQAFIVIQDDNILYEQYFNGASRDSIVTSFSIAKSFTSALIGVAISESHIHSVNNSIIDYLPELAGRHPAFTNITIRDLLMMSSGVKYAEFPFFNGDGVKTYYYPNLRELALEDTQIVGLPGEKFLYNNYHPLLLGMTLERATGTSVTNYLQEKIWKPIGMQYAGSWSLDENGFEKMESGINARAIDFAKFGRLYLRNGNWNGIEVLPAEWVAESTQADSSVDYANYYYDEFIFANGQGYYKYMWWGIQRDAQMYDFIALGNKGQYIHVLPQKAGWIRFMDLRAILMNDVREKDERPDCENRKVRGFDHEPGQRSTNQHHSVVLYGGTLHYRVVYSRLPEWYRSCHSGFHSRLDSSDTGSEHTSYSDDSRGNFNLV